MSEAKFTSGDWLGFDGDSWQSDDCNCYNLDSDRCHSWVEIVCDGQAVAIVPDHEGVLDENAHLIAAAPEMYELLEMLINGDNINDHSIVREAESLLAKARGEQ